MSRPSFGFSDIRPGPARPAEPEREAAVDRVAERAGFVPREAEIRPRLRRKTTEPRSQFNLVARVEDINAFVDWCERERLTYREGFQLLVAKIDTIDT